MPGLTEGIPHIIHQIWFGPPLPDHLAAHAQSWVDLHPTWDYRYWTEDNLPLLRNQALWDTAESIVPGHSVGQFRSDVARYEILHNYGGIYVDCDMEPLRPIDDLIAGLTAFAAWETDTLANNAFMGATPNHPWVMALILGVPDRVARHRGKSTNAITGPAYVTPLAFQHGVTLLPREKIYPYSWDELERRGETFPEAYMVHRWHHRMTIKGLV